MLIRYDDEMCEQMGFICPNCHKPLYEPRSFMNQNGRCPKCRQIIFSDSGHVAELK